MRGALPFAFELAWRGHALVGERFESEHLPAVLGLEEACFPAPWSEALLLQETEPRRHSWNLVVRVDGVVRAFFFNWVVLDEMHLLNFAVAPELQGQGLGGLLLDWLLARAAAAGYAQISLEVRATNAPAIGLYASRDFERVAIRRGYYTDNGEDAVIMLRPLGKDPDALRDP